MTKMTLEEAMRLEGKRLTEDPDYQRQEIMPRFLGLDDDDGLYVFMTPFSGPDSKDLVAQIMPTLLKNVNATAYIFVSEIFRASIPVGEGRASRPASLRDDPRSEEALFLEGFDKANSHYSLLYKITKNEDGTRSFGEPEFKDMSDVKTFGRFGRNFLLDEGAADGDVDDITVVLTPSDSEKNVPTSHQSIMDHMASLIRSSSEFDENCVPEVYRRLIQRARQVKN